MSLSVRFLRVLCVSAVSFVFFTAAAQPLPSLSNTTPIYLRQGESREVPLEGQNLAGAQSVSLAAARGITAVLVAPEKPGAMPLRLKLVATPDAAIGDRELRL